MTTETEVSPATWWREKVLELREMADRTGDLDFQPETLRSCCRWECKRKKAESAIFLRLTGFLAILKKALCSISWR
jgi:hypothetical protein